MAANFVLVFIFTYVCCLQVKSAYSEPKLIVVLIDGFRWDYMNDPDLELKGISRIIQNGVRAPYVDPVYPSLSYVNYQTIVTGLYPENHGFINNCMYNNETGDSFLMIPNPGSTDPVWWNEAEPIWITAEKHGKNAALYWWAGCEVDIKGIQPMICERQRYGPSSEEDKIDFLERIDDVIAMFQPPQKNRLSLAMMYYGSVDYHGHKHGPKSAETRRALKDIDDILYKMQLKISKAGLKNEVNIMVVSDHGMIDKKEASTKYVDLEKFSGNVKFQVASGPVSMLVPENGMLEKLYSDLKEAKIDGINVFKKEEIPIAYHLSKSKLVNDIFIQAQKGFYIKAFQNSTKRIGSDKSWNQGYHGYHPEDVKEMRAIFFATGPGFRKGYTTKPMSNLDLYNIMCHVLQIEPLPNNGSVSILKDILSEGNSHLISEATCLFEHIFCCILPLFVLLFLFITSEIHS